MIQVIHVDQTFSPVDLTGYTGRSEVLPVGILFWLYRSIKEFNMEILFTVSTSI